LTIEHVGNTLGTKEKCKEILPPPPPAPPPKILKEEKQGTLSARLGLPLAASNFYSQKSSSPFLAWATYQKNTCKERPTYSLRLLIMLLLISELRTLTAIFLMQKERHLLAHQQFFLEHWTCPHRSISLEPETNVLPSTLLFSLYTKDVNFGQSHMG
jgi:hypothetical protein